MITLGYLSEAKKMNIEKDAKKMLIVRKPVSGVPNGFHYLPFLSPSTKLFSRTQDWKNNKFTKGEESTLNNLNVDISSPAAWWPLYKPEFEKELRKSKEVKKGIKILKNEMKKGNKIYLFCYCKDLHTCHRLLVGEYLQEIGYEVNFRKIKEKEEKKENEQLNMF